MRSTVAGLSILVLAGCTAAPRPVTPAAPATVEIQVLGINDFHGNLEPPQQSIDVPGSTAGQIVKVPAGGAAYLAGALTALRAGQAHSVTVSAGDLIGASPLVSSLFLDEPTVAAMDMLGLDLNAVGNHEFDKGSAELLRLQNGGCVRHSNRQPCAVEPFTGAKFRFLAANVLTANGQSLLPGTFIKDFGPVQLGFIGMTLKDTPTVTTPAGVAGLSFADEADTANAAIPALKIAGADAIVVLIHQGGRTSGGYNDKKCPNLDGDIMPIIKRLDPAVDLIVSGHTHVAYICELERPGGKPLLLTSAGSYGRLVTDIRLTVSPAAGVVARKADNVIVQGEPFVGPAGVVGLKPAFPVYPRDPQVAALVERYVKAAAPVAARPVGRLSGPLTRVATMSREFAAGDFVADAHLAATKALGAEIAFTNSGGVRADIVPASDGTVTFGQLFTMSPFSNTLVVKSLTGGQIKDLLEQQFASGTNSVDKPNMLLPSAGFFFAYDVSRPAGQRIVEVRLDGRLLDPARTYRVAIVNFLSSGGDNFTVFRQGTGEVDSKILDVEATELWLKAGGDVPRLGRIENRTPTR